MVAQNFCGVFGSFTADLFYQLFGFSAWGFVAMAFVMAYRAFSGALIPLKWSRFSLVLLLVLVIGCLLSIYGPEARVYSKQIHPGGALGLMLAKAMMQAFNPIGVGIILWTLLAVLAVLLTEKPILELFRWPLQQARALGKVFDLTNLFSYEQLAAPRLGKAALEPKPDTESRRFFAIKPEKTPTNPLPSPEPMVGGFLTRKPPAAARVLPKIPSRVAQWELPKMSLLDDAPVSRFKLDEKEIKDKAKLLTEKLAQFSVHGHVVGIKPGPAVTLFEFKPAADVKISRITDLADDLSLALSSESVRIIAPIPGRDVVGIETSNSQREGVYLKDILAQDAFWDEECKLPLALGRQADGEPKVVDLRKMPHLLVAGTTGSGKSVFVVSAICGLLFRHSPKTLRLMLVDPKQVDLAAFNDIPHLIMPPIREAKKAVGALRWAIREMEKRYRSMSAFKARGLEAFNEIVSALKPDQVEEHAKLNSELETQAPMETYYYSELPLIVIVVEEFGDLMAVDKGNVEQAVVRLAQMARACGIHLILAMQSPRKDVVTGLIKTNIPGRVSFKVASKMDSRIILDESGAERLLARGDMLFLAPGVAKPERHHGAYLKEIEIFTLVDHWRSQGAPEYEPSAMKAIDSDGGGFGLDFEGADETLSDDDIKDEKYDEILSYVASMKEVSASLLQRKFRLGYPRAARMIEIFEAEGVIGPANGSKPRQVLVQPFK